MFQKECFRKNIKLIMTIDGKIRDKKNYSIILTEKKQIYQRYHLEKLVNRNMLQVKKYCLLIKEK